MEKQKINLDYIKVAIFDFDDTLAIHKDKNFIKHRNENEDSFINYYLNAYLNEDSFYETIEPCVMSDTLYKMISILKKNGAKVYCVTGMKFSFHLNAKKYFVHKHYFEDIEVISTRSQELKIEAVKIIRRINNCNLDEMLFVDDLEENIVRFKNMGIHALLPDEVDL